ncbi:MAG: isoleucine--tRNA ligase [Planctomycetota bacterium]|nr:MAG: isoleucine--tRNA ligase [Planctomycetota bacterium]
MLQSLGREFLEQPDAFEREILALWERENHLQATLDARRDASPFVFYEGPPTANGRPGIHHVLSRTLKDAVCRFWTMRGRRVLRKAGWDTHGLPVELEVEKKLGLSSKADIERYGIARFNAACRESVFTYKEDWEQLSQRIGFLLDYQHPYVTYHADYIESVWFLLSRYAANGLLYRGYKVLPWCGRCGTGLSSHEVAQGYADIDDPSVHVTFPLRGVRDNLSARPELAELLDGAELVAWTTTPWTLPSNLAACVHPAFEYVVLSIDGRKFVMLEARTGDVWGHEFFEVVNGVTRIQVLGSVKGTDLVGLSYQPLFDVAGLREIWPGPRRHVVVADEFVSAEEGTGVVHLAPYGADDFRIAQRDGISVRLAVGEDGRLLVDVGEVKAGTFFKDADKALSRDLKQRGRLLKQSQYRHSYPHCWRCDTPLLYFPAPAWFLRTTDYRDRMVEENRKIYWAHPEMGSGRFGEWLENNVDWALSRDRYWGTPLPVWVCERDPEHWDCIGSFTELRERCGGLPADFDPHRPGVDALAMPCLRCGGTMRRVAQVVDVWFDSGSMPYAQYHWPFEHRELVAEQFPADYVCEGLDQTRGWFYSLHSIAVFLTSVDQDLWRSGELEGQPLPRLGGNLPRYAPDDPPEFCGAFKRILVNGLLLDEKGQKMSKRLGNTVDPWKAIGAHGADAVRWSLVGGGAPHQSKRYSGAGVEETRRRVLGTLASCYDFLALYSRTEGWTPAAPRPPRPERPKLDRWILSRTAETASQCLTAWEKLDPSVAVHALERLIVEELSNWYVRRSRRRFWSQEKPEDQAAAFATLYEVLHAIVRMSAPIAPFLSEGLWRRLEPDQGSVHVADFPDLASAASGVHARDLDAALEASMEPILTAASLGRAVRERIGVRVRQPLQKLLIHVARVGAEANPRAFLTELKEELNVKEVEWVVGVPDFFQVRAKPNYPRLGQRAGKDMKALAAAIAALDRETLFRLQAGGRAELRAGGNVYALEGEDVLVETLNVRGLEAASDGMVTIALSTELTPELRAEGLAREVVNRIQTQRKESGLDVSDRIRLRLSGSAVVRAAVAAHADWIGDEVLAAAPPQWVEAAGGADGFREWELPGGERLSVALERAAASR